MGNSRKDNYNNLSHSLSINKSQLQRNNNQQHNHIINSLNSLNSLNKHSRSRCLCRTNRSWLYRLPYLLETKKQN